VVDILSQIQVIPTKSFRVTHAGAFAFCRDGMDVLVLYFAAASTATGLTQEIITIPESGCTLSQLPEILIARHRDTNLGKVLESSNWSVDAEMVDDPSTFQLQAGQEIAVICPVSGG